MSQTTVGLRRVLSHPLVYRSFQAMLGAPVVYQKLATDFLKLTDGDRMLDIGCGPAAILEHVDADIVYSGFDVSQPYIDEATERHGGPTVRFFSDLFDADAAERVGEVDVVLLSALLHHLTDDVAERLIRDARSCLRPGGRLITLDPCLLAPQRRVARLLAEKDRGQAVRTPAAYSALVDPHFAHVDQAVTHDLVRLLSLVPVPYDHCFQLCTA